MALLTARGELVPACIDHRGFLTRCHRFQRTALATGNAGTHCGIEHAVLVVQRIDAGKLALDGVARNPGHGGFPQHGEPGDAGLRFAQGNPPACSRHARIAFGRRWGIPA